MLENFEKNLKDIHEKLNLSVSYMTFRQNMNVYLRENYKELKNAPSSFFVWGTKDFKKWFEDNNFKLDDVLEIVLKYVKSSIMMLDLQIKEYNALIKANIKTLNDLKSYITNPKNLLEATGLGLEIIEKIIASYTKYISLNNN